jgi:hypothetical protein
VSLVSATEFKDVRKLKNWQKALMIIYLIIAGFVMNGKKFVLFGFQDILIRMLFVVLFICIWNMKTIKEFLLEIRIKINFK